MQALRTAPLPERGEEARPPYHAMLDAWLASLPDDVDLGEDREPLPPELTSGGIAVTAFYLDAIGQVLIWACDSWPLPCHVTTLFSPASPITYCCVVCGCGDGRVLVRFGQSPRPQIQRV